MSLVIDCDIQSLSLDDIFRMVSAVDADGNYYIRIFNDGTDSDTLNDLVDCESGDITMLDIFRGALVYNVDGEYALNIAAL
jgi:hypothetical protein